MVFLPCPFCGDDGPKEHQVVTQVSLEGWPNYKRVHCYVCGAMCSEQNWNNRAYKIHKPPALIFAEVENIINEWNRPGMLQLYCGEMTAQELRTCKAVLKALATRIERMRQNEL